MQKKQTILVVASLLVVVLSVTLAYFTAQIIGKGKDVSVSSADLKIIFTDSDGAISGSNIEPGWSDTKTFTVENNSKSEYKYNIVIKDLLNTFVTNGYLQYKITSTNDGYNMTEFKDVPKSSEPKDKILAYSVVIPNGVTQSYTIEFKYANDESVDQSDDMGRKLSGKLFITEGTEQLTLLSQILKDNPTRNTRDTYDSVFTNNTTGTLFTATEKNVHNITDTTVYYYAGNTTNNWVKFAGYYWRIIRTNADESVRMLYSGTATDTTSGYLSTGTSKFNTPSNSPKYVGYMYGEKDDTLVNARTNTNNSTIKTAIDNWYASNMTSYTKYLSTTAVYCNDRTEQTVGTYNTGSTNFNYAPYARATTSHVPTYDCTEASDAFSVDNTSAKLTYPIALMTADEIMRAGGKGNTSLTSPYAWYYLNSAGGSITGSIWWWCLSPYRWGGSNSIVWGSNGAGLPGRLAYNGVNDSKAVRPVISLKSCVKTSGGDGSASAPYTIEETSSGC
mgnify:CR=1 FL=1